MDKKTEALKLALEALEEIESYYGYDRSVGAMASSMYEASNLAKITSTRIREALAEQPAQQQEPVAWMHPNWPNYTGTQSPVTTYMVNGWKPLYTSPPASKPWVGLTDEEIGKLKHIHDWAAGWTLEMFARAIEAKLREKNA